MERLIHLYSFRLLVLMSLALGSKVSYCFELLSEGAMDSVSAVSAVSAQDILNIAGSSEAGLSDDYESLPFQTEVSISEFATDEVQTGLDFALTLEVETWVEDLRQQGGGQLEVGFIDELPPSTFDVDPFLFQPSGVIEIERIGEDDDDKTIYQLGRLSQTIELLESGVDSVTYQVERYVERAATINADPFGDGSSIGSGYISDLRSISTIEIAAIRD